MVSTGILQRMRDFTLIEMSIVLVVIGLIISGGIVALGPIAQRGQIAETEGKLDRIEDALVLYAIQNSCLPCPADSNTSGTAAIGEHAITGGNIVPGGACAGASSGDVCYLGNDAVLPWLTLGLQRSDAVDAWGTLITYHISEGATATGANCDDFQDGANVATAAGTGGFSRSGTTYPIGCLDVENEVAAFTTITTAAAYVLISHGPYT